MFLVRFLGFFAVLVLIKCDDTLSTEPICFDGIKENLKLHLGTKTPYRFVLPYRNDSALTYPGSYI